MPRSNQASGSPPKTPKAPKAPVASKAPKASTEPKTPGTPDTQVGDPEAQARQICLRLLTIAPRTQAQLAEALHRRGVPDEAAETVLSRFADVGLIDDAAFARAWVESRHYSRGLSRRSLSAELRRQGVQSQEIREAVDTLDPEQEVATARRLVEQKMAGTRGQPPEVRVRRAAGSLARKGYPAGLVFRLIKEVLEREGEALDLDPDQYADPDDPGE
jgi:regulatory protein